MRFGKRAAAGILIAGLLFAAGVLLRGFLLANFVKPVALLLWSASRLFSSADQNLYWAGLILLLILFSLWRLSRQPAIEEVKREGNGNATLNGIRYWRSLITVTKGEPEGPNFLKRSLEALLKDLTASRQPAQAPLKRFEEVGQEAELPDSIREFLGLDPMQGAPANPPSRTRREPYRLLWRWRKQNPETYYQSIAEVIEYMEKQLEDEDAR